MFIFVIVYHLLLYRWAGFSPTRFIMILLFFSDFHLTYVQINQETTYPFHAQWLLQWTVIQKLDFDGIVELQPLEWRQMQHPVHCQIICSTFFGL